MKLILVVLATLSLTISCKKKTKEVTIYEEVKVYDARIDYIGCYSFDREEFRLITFDSTIMDTTFDSTFYHQYSTEKVFISKINNTDSVLVKQENGDFFSVNGPARCNVIGYKNSSYFSTNFQQANSEYNIKAEYIGDTLFINYNQKTYNTNTFSEVNRKMSCSRL